MKRSLDYGPKMRATRKELYATLGAQGLDNDALLRRLTGEIHSFGSVASSFHRQPPSVGGEPGGDYK